ncbi:hypothetical protein ACHAW5_007754 [Stephanodiscus triporus]|uniref:Uncharacterized protein n=1 Tax=Stephanodiscus triporus TaxID=2934178 RepID=A0ABD3PQD7_9STRA
MKLRRDGHLAAEIFVYVDNWRPTGHSPVITWKAARASRKRTSPTETPGPWAGTVTHTEGGSVVGMVSQEKWDKTKRLIDELCEMVARGPLPLQRMLEIRGFLMYVVRTYMWMNPYIKGMHNTIDSWREGRAEDGFKMMAKERKRIRSLLAEAMGLPCQKPRETGKSWQWASVQELRKGLRRRLCYQRRGSYVIWSISLYRAAHQSSFFVIGDASGKANGSAVVEQ